MAKPRIPAILLLALAAAVALAGQGVVQQSDPASADASAFTQVSVDIQYLACGNADGSPVDSPSDGALLADPLDTATPTPIPGDINGDTVVDTGDIHLDIDMKPDGTSTDGKPVWCQNIDTTATHAVGDTYQVAICLTSSPISPAGFTDFILVYDDSLNTCVPVDCGSDPKCLDSDPDANTGTTIFGNSTAGAAISLGSVAWNCNVLGPLAPSCDRNAGTHGPGAGRAFLQCIAPGALQSDLTLPVGAGVSAPIAVLTFTANSPGTDTLSLDQLSVIKLNGDEIVGCWIDEVPNRCLDGTDIKITPTPTRQPGVGGIQALPDSDASAGDSSAPPYLALACVAAASVVALAAGGWYARRRRLR